LSAETYKMLAPALPRKRDAKCSARAADRQTFDLQRRLTNTDGYALPFFAARTHAIVELQIVSNHRDARQNIGAVADQRGALDGSAQATILDRVGLACREHEFARGNIDLSATKVHGIDPVLHGADDLLRIMWTGPHIGIRHARQGHV